MVTGWRTAVARRYPSAPVRWLLGNGGARHGAPRLLRAASIRDASPLRGLDYGCGRGRDAEYLGFAGYDPYWRPARPNGPYDVVLCTYVLNVLPVEDRAAVLIDVWNYLAPGGRAFLSVRRDVARDAAGPQYWVELSASGCLRICPTLIHECSRFAIYQLFK